MDQILQYWQTKLKAITPEPKEKIAFNKWHEILWAKVWWKWNPAQLIYIHVGIDLKGVFSRNANMELFLSMEIVALHGGNLEKYFIEFKTKIFTNTFLSDPGSIIVYACHSLTHSLTHDLVEDWMNWPNYADYADYADYAEYLEYAEYAEYAEQGTFNCGFFFAFVFNDNGKENEKVLC